MEPSRPPGLSPLYWLRLIPVTATFTLVGLFGLLAVVGQRFTEADTLWIALPLILGAADLALVPAVGSTVRPLPYGVGQADAKRIALGVLRTVTLLRLGLAEAPALFGLAASFITDSLLPYAIGFAFSVPLLLFFTYPRAAVVEAVRERLESGGVASHLWEALDSPP